MDRAAEAYGRIRHFAELVGGAPDETPLDLAVATIGSVLRPTFDMARTLETLDDLAERVQERTFDGVRCALFERAGFRGNEHDYDHPDNSMLDLVLQRGTGLPILLAVVAIEVGRRVAVPMVGIGMPMHFLVRDAEDEEAFLDPFTGDFLDPDGARRRLDEVSGGRVTWSDRFLRAVPARHIVIRVLTNLQSSFKVRNDPVRLALVARLRAEVPELHSERGAAIRRSAIFN